MSNFVTSDTNVAKLGENARPLCYIAMIWLRETYIECS